MSEEQPPKVVGKYAGGGPPQDTPPASAVVSEAQKLVEAFRGLGLAEPQEHLQLMLELRLKDGNRKVLGYSHLIGVDFNPSQGIVLEFSGHRVTIGGRNLLPIFNGIAAHTQAYIQEVDAMADNSAEPDTVVTELRVEEV